MTFNCHSDVAFNAMEGDSDKCTMACTAHLVNKFASWPVGRETMNSWLTNQTLD
jgi:hypothetical protein